MENKRRFGFIGAALVLSAAVPNAVTASEGASAGEGAEQIVAAFEQTCRRGFPDLDAVERAAVTSGWTASGIRAVGGNARFQAATLPRVFRKDGLTLFLTTSNSMGMKHSCQVASSDGRSVDLDSLAGETASRFEAGTPELSRSGGADLAQWRGSGSLLMQASVSRRPRSASLQIRVER